MAAAKLGDTVKVHYTGTLADGTQFDSSRGREPLQLTLGEGAMLPDFEEAILGMADGERKTVTIPCESAFGEHVAELNLSVPRESIGADLELAVGSVLRATGPEGETANFVVLGFEDENVIMDGNHPLAGHDLTYELELMQIA